jgi:hypothetical protein
MYSLTAAYFLVFFRSRFLSFCSLRHFRSPAVIRFIFRCLRFLTRLIFYSSCVKGWAGPFALVRQLEDLIGSRSALECRYSRSYSIQNLQNQADSSAGSFGNPSQ